MDLPTLYASNCAGCHGTDGRNGAARPLHDGLYLTLIGKQRLRHVIAQGVPNTAMPAFAEDAGGTLTAKQIDVLADQMMLHWSRAQSGSGASQGAALPPYSAENAEASGVAKGTIGQGLLAFRRYCASCHGEDGTGGVGLKGGSAVDPAYLALASDQSLRTTVILGRSDQGIPDWRSYVPGHAMSPQEISDVVAWLARQRKSAEGLARGE
jgi:mono/diheme cytochrome c family protein